MSNRSEKGEGQNPEPQSLTAWFFAAATGLFATETQNESGATEASTASSAEQQNSEPVQVTDHYEEYAEKETGRSFGI